jgi:hypothetical protein
MAVVFTATPNPVPFTQAQVAGKARKTVSLSWGTGNPAVSASVYRSANAAPESVLPGAANKPASTGTVTNDLGFSDTVVYTLRDTAKRSLAQVTVRTALSIPAPPVPPSSPAQDIRDVRVVARGDVIWLRFGTGLPSSPWVELIDASTNALAGYWARPGIGTTHSMMFDGIGSPLRQGHEYRFRIVAERSATVDPRTNPQLSGRIFTGTRRAVVRFGGASLAAHGQGSVFGFDYSFYAAAGDVDAWTVGGHRTLADPMPAGGSIFCDEQIAIEPAGRTLWASLTVQHRNSGSWWKWTPFASDLTQEPRTPPPQGFSGWASESEDVQRAVIYLECHPSLLPGPDPGPLLPLTESHTYTLGNPNAFEAYEAALFVDITLTDGRWNFDGWSPHDMRLYRFSHAVVTQLRPGLVVALLGGRAMSTTLALAPSGHLAVTREKRAHASHSVATTSAQLVPGTIRAAAAITADDGSGHVAGIDDSGRVYWTSLDDTDPAWTDLGLEEATAVTLVAGADVVHVLAITADGRLRHAVAGANAHWSELSDGVRSCATVGSDGASPAVVAVFADGAVRHRDLSEVGAGEGAWTELGMTAPGDVAVARHDDGSLSVLVLADDGPVALLGWPGYPHPDAALGWERLGDYADLARGVAAADSSEPELGLPSEIEADHR